jgi:hypothetical protein
LNNQAIKLVASKEAWTRANVEQALALVREAQRLDPGDATAASNVSGFEGWLAANSGDLDTALSKFQKALQLRPDSTGWQQGVAWMQSKIKERNDKRIQDAQAASQRQSVDDLIGSLRSQDGARERNDAGAAKGNLDFMAASPPGSSESTTPSPTNSPRDVKMSGPSGGLSFMGLEPFPPGNPKSVTLKAREKGPSGVEKDTGKLAGAQGKSAAADGRAAATASSNEQASERARRVFDDKRATPAGTLRPERTSQPVTAPPASNASTLASRIPQGARADSQIKQTVEWYQHLDALKNDARKKITELKQQQGSGTVEKTTLEAKLATLTNQVTQYNKAQGQAEEQIKKRVKDLGFEWKEASAPSSSAAPPPSTK